MNIEIVITWYNGKLVSLWYADKLIWETEDIVVDVNLLKTIVVLPLLESIKFIAIFINGMTVNNLAILFERIKLEIAELEKLQNNNVNTNIDINDNEW